MGSGCGLCRVRPPATGWVLPLANVSKDSYGMAATGVLTFSIYGTLDVASGPSLTSLACVPVYFAGCKVLAALCGDTFLHRLEPCRVICLYYVGQ